VCVCSVHILGILTILCLEGLSKHILQVNFAGLLFVHQCQFSPVEFECQTWPTEITGVGFVHQYLV
jgi:hypothetical protein